MEAQQVVEVLLVTTFTFLTWETEKLWLSGWLFQLLAAHLAEDMATQ